MTGARARAVPKHLVELDEAALTAARAERRTSTIKVTVNDAPRRATRDRQDGIAASLVTLAEAELNDRTDAWC